MRRNSATGIMFPLHLVQLLLQGHLPLRVAERKSVLCRRGFGLLALRLESLRVLELQRRGRKCTASDNSQNDGHGGAPLQVLETGDHVEAAETIYTWSSGPSHESPEQVPTKRAIRNALGAQGNSARLSAANERQNLSKLCAS